MDKYNKKEERESYTQCTSVDNVVGYGGKVLLQIGHIFIKLRRLVS